MRGTGGQTASSVAKGRTRSAVTGPRVAALGSVLLHVGFLVWQMERQPADASRATLDAVELVAVQPLTPGPLAERAEQRAPELAAPGPAADDPVAAPSDPAPPPPPPKPAQQPRRPKAAHRPAKPSDPTAPSEPDAPVAPDVPADPPAADAMPVTPAPTGAEETPAAASTPAPGPSTGSASTTGGGGDGHGASGAEGGGEDSFRAYGAEIVRLVKAEIDSDPVLGITKRDSIELQLSVLPNGRLARTGNGRWDFVRVIRTSLGPLRTRGILKRIQNASARFPSHPDGFSKRRYVVGVTVHFKDHV